MKILDILIGMKGKEEKLFYTVNEMAEMLGCTRQNVYKLIRTGKLPARRWGKHPVILKEDLQNFFKSLPFVRDMG